MEARHAGSWSERAAGALVSASWRISVDQRLCIGSGLCAASAPDHFRLADNRSRPVRELVDAQDVVLDAAECCPAEAITVIDVAVGRLLAPRPD